MEIWEAALWALLGAGVHELTLIFALMRPTTEKKTWGAPWKKGDVRVFCIALAIRLFISGGLAAPLAKVEYLSNELAFFAVGIAAPTIMNRFFTVFTALAGKSVGEATNSFDPYGQSDPALGPVGSSGTIPEARSPELIEGEQKSDTGDTNAT